MKESFLNEKELDLLNKSQKYFRKTAFGKRIGNYLAIIGTLTVMSFIIGVGLLIVGIFNDNYEFYGIMCMLVAFCNIGVLLLAKMQYESMIMNYVNFKK